MIGNLTNALRQHQSDGSTHPRKGTISGYDPSSHSVKVTVQPEGFDTGWIQLSALGVGNGWGVVTGPQLGDQVSLSFDGGDLNLGHVTGRYFSDASPPPAVPSGETWIVHSSGSLLKFRNDGTVSLHSGVALNYDAPQHNFTGGPISMDHALTVTGDVIAGTVSLQNHLHNGGTISGKTSAPIA
ncbi:phage baseplate assembly protein V [Pseudomonas sp. CCC3.2]|uniref:phage baseplate assembly protein V n=1 Tax=unclassified Pseudomonas TaxID=196821 RepID=UPI002AB502C4|nr:MULTISPECIES: phage baseplate assembly protein V [unclassified Pseudomonas]MDY7559974.1 phage baseplate assembly protein V [Pseudomonas sp. AB6]MEB0179386.1 phage baseplate assembly protein V [Pseudomonas sp. CCC3.2]MEB0210452.1 phage baseplate assembly protein V [Pseudomonas sp. AB6]